MRTAEEINQEHNQNLYNLRCKLVAGKIKTDKFTAKMMEIDRKYKEELLSVMSK